MRNTKIIRRVFVAKYSGNLNFETIKTSNILSIAEYSKVPIKQVKQAVPLNRKISPNYFCQSQFQYRR